MAKTRPDQRLGGFVLTFFVSFLGQAKKEKDRNRKRPAKQNVAKIVTILGGCAGQNI